METQTLMDITIQHHQGRLGTPDAKYQASYMSSDFKNKQQEQHTSQMTAYGNNAQDLFAKLNEALGMEPKYQPNLFLPLQSNVSVYLFFTFWIFFFLWKHETQFKVLKPKSFKVNAEFHKFLIIFRSFDWRSLIFLLSNQTFVCFS